MHGRTETPNANTHTIEFDPRCSGQTLFNGSCADPWNVDVCIVHMYVLFIFILHSRESELYRYILDGTSALAWELPFPRCLGHLSST